MYQKERECEQEWIERKLLMENVREISWRLFSKMREWVQAKSKLEQQVGGGKKEIQIWM